MNSPTRGPGITRHKHAARARDLAGQDLILTARAVGPETERAAWMILAARLPEEALHSMREMLHMVVNGVNRPSGDRSAWALRVKGRLEAMMSLETAARREAWGRQYLSGASLSDQDRARVLGLLRGKRPQDPARQDLYALTDQA